MNRRALVLLGALFAVLLVLPAFANSYVLSVATLILYFAYTGQAWNVMMGVAGQLSLGHSLYVGVGAYVAAALFVKLGIGPWARPSRSSASSVGTTGRSPSSVR